MKAAKHIKYVNRVGPGPSTGPEEDRSQPVFMAAEKRHQHSPPPMAKAPQADRFGVSAFVKANGLSKTLSSQLSHALDAEGSHMDVLLEQLRLLGDSQARELLQSMGLTPLNAAVVVAKVVPTPSNRSQNLSR